MLRSMHVEVWAPKLIRYELQCACFTVSLLSSNCNPNLLCVPPFDV